VETVRVKYSGPKKRIAVSLPVPFIAKSEAAGDDVVFEREKDKDASWAQVPAQYVEALCGPDSLFSVDQPKTTDTSIPKTPALSGGVNK